MILAATMVASSYADDSELLITNVNHSSIYVISDSGVSNEQDCTDSDSVEPTLVEILEGVSAGTSCEIADPLAFAWTDCSLGVTYLTSSQDAFLLEGGGNGEAYVSGAGNSFSRHIIHTILRVKSTEDAVVGVHWSLHSSGLGDALVRLRNPSNVYVLQEEVSSYILPVMEEGVMVLDMLANQEWTITIYTDHQAMHNGGSRPKFDVSMAQASLTMAVQQGHTGDLNGDGTVDGADLALVLVAWGVCDGCPADFNGDGLVDGGDLAMILVSWTN